MISIEASKEKAEEKLCAHESVSNMADKFTVSAKLIEGRSIFIRKLSIASRSGRGEASELVRIADRLRQGADYKPSEVLKAYGPDGTVDLVEPLKASEAIRKLTDNFASITSKVVYQDTTSGYSASLIDDYCENLLMVDGGSATEVEFGGRGPRSFIRFVADYDKVIRLRLKGQERDFYYLLSSDENVFLRPEAVNFPKKNIEFCRLQYMRLTADELTALLHSGLVEDYDIFMFLNASPSSMRQGTAIYIRLPKSIKKGDEYRWLYDKLEAMTNGLFSAICRAYKDGSGYEKAVKLMSRLSLGLTDAVEYKDAVQSFCMVNSKYSYEGTECFDGAFYMSIEVMRRIFAAKFGHEPSSDMLDAFLGDAMQGRINCQIKGEAQLLSKSAMSCHLNAVLRGALGGETHRIILIHNEEEALSFKMEKGDMVFSGPAFKDISCDAGFEVTDKAKIAALFSSTDVIGDMNAYKFDRIITSSQSFNLMSMILRKENDSTISISNQIGSTVFAYKNTKATSPVCEGAELAVSLCRENLAEIFKTKSEIDRLSFKDFSNFEGYADTAISHINWYAYMADPHARATAAKQLLEKVNTKINCFNIEVSGFNAVAIIDPGLVIAGSPLLKKDEMFSGNVTNGSYKKVAVFRHPLVHRTEYSLLYDMDKNVLIKRAAYKLTNGEISQAEFECMVELLDHTNGRMAAMPTFDPNFPKLHGGSDNDGDAFSVITDSRLVKILSKFHAAVPQIAIDYGSVKGREETVIFSLTDTNHGTMSPRRAFCAFYDTGNLSIGQVARFNNNVVGLLDAIEMGWFKDEDFAALKANLGELDEDSPLEDRVFFNNGLPRYEGYFKARVRNGCVLIDASQINMWRIYCSMHSVHDAATLKALLEDIALANSSVMGRIIDAAKTGEAVYAPFVERLSAIKSSYGKNRIGYTDIGIGYIGQDFSDITNIGEDKFYITDDIALGSVVYRANEYSEPKNFYCIGDVARYVKRVCAVHFVKAANEWLRELDLEIASRKAQSQLTTMQLGETLDSSLMGLRNIARINSGIMGSRRDIINDIAPYMAGAVRNITSGLSLADRIHAAFSASFREKRETAADDAATKVPYTRFYRKLGAELGILALLDNERAGGSKDILLSDRIYATTDYVFTDGETLDFRCGLAKLRCGYAICGKLDGSYKVKVYNSKEAYIEGSLLEYLAGKALRTDKFIANVAAIQDTASLDNDAKNRAMAQSIRKIVEVVNTKGYQSEHFIFSRIYKGYGAFLLSRPKAGGSIEIIAKLSLERFNADKDTDGQYKALDGTFWHIDNVTSYIDKSDKCYGIVCMSRAEQGFES